MESLVRTRSGRFVINEAVTLDTVQRWADEGELEKHILSVEEVFKDSGYIRLKSSADKLIHNGNTFSGRDTEDVIMPQGETAVGEAVNTYRVYDSADIFYGVYSYDEKRRIYKPYKMFIP